MLPVYSLLNSFLLCIETDNKRTPGLPQRSFQLELSSSDAQWRVREEEENEEQEELLVLDPEHVCTFVTYILNASKVAT